MMKPSPGTKFYGTKMLLKLTYSKVEFQNFAGGNTPGPPCGRGRPPPEPTPSTAFGRARRLRRRQKLCPYLKILSTPLWKIHVAIYRDVCYGVNVRQSLWATACDYS